MAHRRRSQPSNAKAPDYLDEIARAEWDRVLPELEELGFFDPVFTEMLGGYCSVFSTATYHEGLCEKHGDDHVLEEGTEFAETTRERADGYWEEVFELAVEFGLTPESRRDITAYLRREGLKSMRDWRPELKG